jgi:hypothetical protein
MTCPRVVAKRPIAEVAAISIDNACATGRQSHSTIDKRVLPSGGSREAAFEADVGTLRAVRFVLDMSKLSIDLELKET